MNKANGLTNVQSVSFSESVLFVGKAAQMRCTQCGSYDQIWKLYQELKKMLELRK